MPLSVAEKGTRLGFMIPHWAEQRAALRHWLATHPRLFIGSDFDGTLSVLRPHADEACLPEATRDILCRLAELPGITLAFISGRSLQDLRQRVGIKGVLYAGNHGLEMTELGSERIRLAPTAEQAVSALRSLRTQLETQLAHLAGVWVEDKLHTLSVHFRQADMDDHPEVEAIVRRIVREAPALEIRPAKRIWEVRPAIEWDKGSALREFLRATDIPTAAAAFMGDDISDGDAFREIPDGWSFAVGTECGPGARLHVQDPQDTAHLLDWIVSTRSTL